jgi:N-acetylneuraminate synthase
MVDAAREAGADAIKFQTFKAELNVTPDTEMASYQKRNTGKNQGMYKLLKGLELTEENFYELKEYCDRKGIIFLSTAHSNEWSVDVLEKLNVQAHKIPSGEVINLPLLEYVAKTGKPIIMSTGMAAMQEIREAVDTIRKAGNEQLILMQCTTEYPCPVEHANLKAINTLQEKFDTLVGYSDHTTSTLTPAIAVALGACMIEKHFTLDRGMEGPDHKASLEPSELREMVKNVRYAEKALGSGIKKPTANEVEIAKVARKSIVSCRDIKKGQVITKEMLSIKRPGIGILPKYLGKIVGKKAKNDMKKNSLVRWEDFE